MKNIIKYRTIHCEDDVSIREFFYSILEERGHEIFSYNDAHDCPLCIHADCECPPLSFCADIIVTDLSMPQMSGLQFIEKLRERGCKIKNIAIVSGYWIEKDISRAKELGCWVFHKPLRPEELCEWLDNCEKNIDPGRILLKVE